MPPGSQRNAPSVERRSLVPARASGSLTVSALWTGAVTAVVGAVTAVAAVALCWLPFSGSAGSAHSAIRAGLLTFLAALHGGVTVNGLSADFVPLGMTLAVLALAWRAGTGLADAAAELDERRPGTLSTALGLQAFAFALVCAVAGRFATLGTSSVPALGSGVAAFVLFALGSGAAMLQWSPLGESFRSAAGPWAQLAVRVAAAVVATYLLGGALLVAASLGVHHDRVEALSHQVGGGWSGLPVLLLGLLAAPNAAIAGGSYLAGPGFAVGSGNGISLAQGGHGVLPAFPVLAGVPAGPASAATWSLAALTLVVTAVLVGVLLVRGHAAWGARFADLGRAAVLVALAGLVLGWQAGGAIGDGRLAAVGPSPWQLGFALAAVTVVGGTAGLGLAAALARLRGRSGTRTAARLQAIAEAATSVADRLDERLESSRTVVELPDAAPPRGIVRGTLSSVARAVTTTDDERAAG